MPSLMYYTALISPLYEMQEPPRASEAQAQAKHQAQQALTLTVALLHHIMEGISIQPRIQHTHRH